MFTFDSSAFRFYLLFSFLHLCILYKVSEFRTSVEWGKWLEKFLIFFFFNASRSEVLTHTSNMGTLEQPCYTLIQAPTDTEQPCEMTLKRDLGKT